jgi:hypothetical protein
MSLAVGLEPLRAALITVKGRTIRATDGDGLPLFRDLPAPIGLQLVEETRDG